MFSVDQKFAISLKPETVAVVDDIPNLIFVQCRKNPTPWAYNPSFLRTLIEDAYADYFAVARYWLIDTEADDGGERGCKLIDLQSVARMEERQFIRRIASLRNAWRLYLSSGISKRPRSEKRDDDQPGLDFGDD
jgi:hypothetical protein